MFFLPNEGGHRVTPKSSLSRGLWYTTQFWGTRITQIYVFRSFWKCSMETFRVQQPMSGRSFRGPFGRTYQPALQWRFLSYLTGWGRFLGFQSGPVSYTELRRLRCFLQGAFQMGRLGRFQTASCQGLRLCQVSYPARQFQHSTQKNEKMD